MTHNLKLTNSLTRQKELFKPINPKTIKVRASINKELIAPYFRSTVNQYICKEINFLNISKDIQY